MSADRPSRDRYARQAQDLVFIAVVSAVILAYQVLLTRILAVHYWSYFASMIVSLAMLGFAASGTALFLLTRFRKDTAGWLPWMTICFIVSIPVCPRLSEMIHCMPLVILWNARQFWLFAANYLILSLPFFFGAFIIGHFFVGGTIPAGRVYFANMLGSGAGVFVSLALLGTLRPVHALGLSVIPVIAVALFYLRHYVVHTLTALILLLPLTLLALPKHPEVSPYKGMHNLLLVPDAKIEYAAWTRFGYLTVIDSKTIRYAPGLSLLFAGTLPDQKAIFTNGDDREVVCAGKDPEKLSAYFDAMLSGILYHFHEQPEVLAIGAGGGMDVLNAVVHDAKRVDAVENNTALRRLMTGPLSRFSGHLYGRSNVYLQAESARDVARCTTNRYDLVIVPARRSLFASAAGTSAQDPDYLLTRQGLADFFSLLKPGGVMGVETWLNLPPRHSARLFATAAAFLNAQGLQPEKHLVAARSLRTALLLIFRNPVTAAQVSGIRRFLRRYSFDAVYFPGITPGEVNLRNQVEGAPYYTLFRKILDRPEDAFDAHIFRIDPPSDNRPYFSHFFKWAGLPQLLEKTGRNVAIHIGWGYMFLLITLVQAIPLGALLILLPLAVFHRGTATPYPHRKRACLYFTMLGFGFMFLELTVIQQFVRFLPHPVYAFGITIGLILLCSGAGSFFSGHRLLGNRLIFGCIIGLMLLHLLIWTAAIHYRGMLLFYVDVAAIGILAFFMGMPFPRGVDRLQRKAPGLVPWAWGINGFISVIAVLAAGLAALSWGLSTVIVLAVLCYLAAAFTVPV